MADIRSWDLRTNVAILAWIVILCQSRDDDRIRCQWRFSQRDKRADDAPWEVLDVEYTALQDQTIEEQLSKLALKTRGNVLRSASGDQLILASGINGASPLHGEIVVGYHNEALAITHSNGPPSREFMVQRHIDAILYIISICESQPEMTIAACIIPTTLDLDSIWSWNSPLPPTIHECIYERISMQAQFRPSALAVHAWDGDFTYQDIEVLSNHYSANLIQAGVMREDIIPVCFEKSRWTIIATLAVMKAGATFVLMDPTLPLARLQNMAQQVGARLVVASDMQTDLAKAISPLSAVTTVSSSRPAELQPLAADKPVPPSTIMYIIFTSGSTGTPKGVKISHETYTSSAVPRALEVGYNTSSRVLDFASYAFDVSIDNMFLTTMSGGCLCIPSDDDRMNDINQVMRHMSINYAGLTPSVARILEPEVIASLVGLGLGGEAVSASDVTIWGEDARIIIGYGPCECTVGCTINGNAATGRDYISIGKGNGAAIWIVDPDDHDRLLPLGAVGELLVEGPIVGQGYLNDPEKTAAVFIESPRWLSQGHAEFPGRHTTLYKTGDLGRYDPDGSGGIVFVGRKDTQVKLRGQRVELGEIESQLRSQMPDTIDVIVEVTKNDSQSLLLAFVASRRSTIVLMDACRIEMSAEVAQLVSNAQAAIKETLPIYMLPSAYVAVNSIPKLISGKVDRKRLRQLGSELDRRTLDDTTAPDLNPSELMMAQLWQKVLPTSGCPLSSNSNFFLLGGDSVKAMKLVPLGRAGGLHMTVADIFSNPTLSSMAAASRMITSNNEYPYQLFDLVEHNIPVLRDEAAAICHVPSEKILDIFACTPTQESLFTFSLKSSTPYVAQRVALLPAHITTAAWKLAWDKVVGTFAIMRTRVAQLSRRSFDQVVIDEGITWRHSDDLAGYLAADVDLPINAGDSLARYCMVEQKDDRRYMVWTIHHMIYDGWSEPLMIETLRNALRDVPIEPPVSICEVVRFLTPSMLDKMHDFWRSELQGAVHAQFPQLPYRDYVPTQEAVLEHVAQLPPLKNIPYTLATLIRGALALVLSHHVRTNDIVFGETMSGRDTPLHGVENIAGPLVATVPCRIRVDHKMSIGEYLRRTQAGVSARAPYQQFGMQNIRKVSGDAEYACETGTGIVIHSEVTDTFSDLGFETIDVVRESLNFNPYPLMLAFGLQPDGFRVCAGFDSSLIDPQLMRRILRQMETACVNMIGNLSLQLSVIPILPEQELREIMNRNMEAPLSLDLIATRLRASDDHPSGKTYPPVASQWVCSLYDQSVLVPHGCIGELWLESNFLPGSSSPPPAWLQAGYITMPSRRGHAAPTGDAVRLEQDGTITYLGRVADFVSSNDDQHALHSLLGKALGTTWAYRIERTAAIPSDERGKLVVLVENARTTEPHAIPATNVVNMVERSGKAFQFGVHEHIAAPLAEKLKELDQSCRDILPLSLTPFAYLVGSSVESEHTLRNSQLEHPIAVNVAEELGNAVRDVWDRAAEVHLTQEQIVLRTYWAEVLQRPQAELKLQDGFFRLGGDSVLAMKLSSRLKRDGWSLSVADVFRTIRLERMAACLTKASMPDQIVAYKPFSTIAEASVEELLARTSVLKTLPSDAEVLDILPVTMMQELDILATLQMPRTSYQYTIVNLKQVLDKNRLQMAFDKLVKMHAILRTVFLEYGSSYVQVVLDRVEGRLDSMESTGSTDALAEQYCADNIEDVLIIGQPFLRAALITGGDRKCSIILGLSHAQYDGISLPRLLDDLGQLYIGQDIHIGPSFSAYVAAIGRADVVEPTIHYWRTLLNGSSMSVLERMECGAAEGGLFKSQAIDVDDRIEDFTPATLLTSAWSLVLARYLKTTDVTFGTVTSGRTSRVDDVEQIVGPCYNIMPVRIAFGQHWTAKNLLDAVQRQCIESAPHDFLGFKEIASRCTQWSDGVDFFDSIVHDQPADDSAATLFGDIQCRFDAIKPHGDAAAPFKVVTFVVQGQMHVGLVGAASEAHLIDRVLSLVVEAMNELISLSPVSPLLAADLFEIGNTLDSP